ncbi:MAG TPA: proton-conducting transporter membrane subunit [Terrimicrobiaceae bacterium]
MHRRRFAWHKETFETRASFLIFRLWFDVAAGLTGEMAGQVLGAMGAGAILAGGVVALRQDRLKLLIAYSTVAQLGYLFLMFPLAARAGSSSPSVNFALAGGMLLTAASLLWIAAGAYAPSYFRGRTIGGSLPVCWLSTLVGNLGIFLLLTWPDFFFSMHWSASRPSGW